MDRRRYILRGAAGGLLLGAVSAFLSPAALAEGMVDLPLQIAVVLGMTALGALFGSLEFNAR